MTRIPGPGGGRDPDPERERHEQRLRLLEQLADVGLKMARGLMARVEGRNGAPPEPLTMEIVDAFVRISRSVRLCIALSGKLEAAGPAPRRRPAPPTGLPAQWQAGELAGGHAGWLAGGSVFGSAAMPDRGQRERERAWVRHVVERSIVAGANLRRREGLFLHMEDLLEEAESEVDEARRPLDEIVGEICEALGITPDPNLLIDTGMGRDKPARGASGRPILPAPRRPH